MRLRRCFHRTVLIIEDKGLDYCCEAVKPVKRKTEVKSLSGGERCISCERLVPENSRFEVLMGIDRCTCYDLYRLGYWRCGRLFQLQGTMDKTVCDR
jgi:hypothetical protein